MASRSRRGERSRQAQMEEGSFVDDEMLNTLALDEADISDPLAYNLKRMSWKERVGRRPSTQRQQQPSPHPYQDDSAEARFVRLHDLTSTLPYEEDAETHLVRTIEARMEATSWVAEDQHSAGRSSNFLADIPHDRLQAMADVAHSVENKRTTASSTSSSSNRKTMQKKNDGDQQTFVHGVGASAGSTTSSIRSGAQQQQQNNNNSNRRKSTLRRASSTKQLSQSPGARGRSNGPKSRAQRPDQRLMRLSVALNTLDEEDIFREENDRTAPAEDRLNSGTTNSALRGADALFRNIAKKQEKKERKRRKSVMMSEEFQPESLRVDEESGRSLSELDFAAASPIDTFSKRGSVDLNDSGKASSLGDTSHTLQNTTAIVARKLHLALKEDWEVFNQFLTPRRATISLYIKTTFLLVVFPCIVAASILFYFVENPYTGYTDEANDKFDRISDHDGVRKSEDSAASISWWLIFLGVRQVVTFSLTLATQAFVVDYLAVSSFISLRLLGPVVTMLVVGSKGWPFIAFTWALSNIILLSGQSDFVNHWGYWQDYIRMFNNSNPSGTLLNNSKYLLVLKIAIAVSMVVSVKRLIMGIFLSQRTYKHYNAELTKIMASMLLIGEVAKLSKNYEEASLERNRSYMHSQKKSVVDLCHRGFEETSALADDSEESATPQSRSFDLSERQKIMQLLDEWEEPEREDSKSTLQFSLSAILQFRRALTFMDKEYPFSAAFGPAYERDVCIDSSQEVFDRLLRIMHESPTITQQSDDILDFEVIALAAKDISYTGLFDEDKVKDLVKLFRPSREGKLTRLEFVKSVDNVYKAMRLLSASVFNSSQIDRALENCLNVAFYALMTCVILATLGIDPISVFLSFSSVTLAFAFIFGTASARYFEGLLLILVQRPYDVGDRIHVSNPASETDPFGASTWIVENVGLFHTTVYWGVTGERATFANGAISSLRIINGARSPNAKLKIPVRFGINASQEKIKVFNKAVESFVKSRPREWRALEHFRTDDVVVHKGYVEYVITVRHRESWQNIASVCKSRADLKAYCLELSKRLDLLFVSPHLPVDLTITNDGKSATKDSNKTNVSSGSISEMLRHFQSLGGTATQGFNDHVLI